MGAKPDWVDVMTATAGYTPPPPWELLERPYFWLAVERAYRGAIADARNARNP